MIPITKRLNCSEKEEYIRQVLALRKKWKGYEFAIRTFCETIKTDYPLPDCGIEDDLHFTEYKLFPYTCKWLVMSFNDIRQIQELSEEKNKYHNDYIKLRDSVNHFLNIYDSFSGANVNNWIIDTSEVRICPYCNLAYTFNRETKTMGQLDHFYPKSEFPEFALCYYNLIPSCSTCNRIKGKNADISISPYEDEAFSSVRIIATASKRINYMNLSEAEKNIELEILSDRPEELDNVKLMKLDAAYSHVRDYAAEILKKRILYKNECSRQMIINTIKKAGITEDEILRFYFGNYINEPKGKRILDKLASDLYNQDEYT